MRPSYFKIGLFVIIAGVLILAAIIVFGSGLFTEKKIYIETYFDESVSGLTLGAPVELRGVRIGQVEKVAFIRDEYDISGTPAEVSKYEQYILVLCSIQEENMLKISEEERSARLNSMLSHGLRVRLLPNILTGQAYLEADYLDPERFPVLKIGWEPRHTYVSSAPGEYSTLKDSVDKVLYKLQEIDLQRLIASVEKVIASLDAAINDADLPGISRDVKTLLTSLDKTVADSNVPGLSMELQSLFAEARETNQDLNKLFESSKPDAGQSNLPETIARLNKTLGRIDKLVAGETPQVEIILANFREISENLKDLIQALKQHPSELLFSEPPSQSEALK